VELPRSPSPTGYQGSPHLAKTRHSPGSNGSVSKYEGTIAQERKAGRDILSATDGKQVSSWGGMRNDAAHDPVKFGMDRTVPEVRIMVEGIRQFVARVVA
jgi:hypothetical protein